MRVALISDLHGNIVSLRAVLDHIAASKVDRIVCLGDCATLGPSPDRVLETLHDLGCPCILGNHDDFLLDADLVRKYTEQAVVVDAVDACRASLDKGSIDFVRTFKHTLEMELDGAMLALFHGSPRSHMEDLVATTSPEDLDDALSSMTGTVMAGGHTHVQMVRQHRGILLVNPGSLGMPFERYVAGKPPRIMAHAEYAIVESVKGEVGVTLQRVNMDRQALIAGLDGWDNPLRGYLAKEWSLS